MSKKTADSKPGKTGPKPKQVDWKKVDKMCEIQCTGEEIASVLGMSYDTLERRFQEDWAEETDEDGKQRYAKFADYMREKRQGGNVNIRRKQYQLALKGDRTMLVWLGKNRLNQTDKQDIHHSGEIGINIAKDEEDL